MLFKDLKKIIIEQNEINVNNDDKQKSIKKEIPKRAKRDVEAVKVASDGIGNESYDIAAKVAEFLGTVLPSTYPEIREVEAEKAIVIIKNAAKIMKSEKAKEFNNVIQQYVAATLGTKGMREFKISGPFPANRDVNIVFQLAK